MRFKILAAALLCIGLVQSSFGSTITNGNFSISGTLFVTDFRTTAVLTPAGTCPASVLGMACLFWQDSTGTTTGKLDITASGLPNGDIPAALAGNLAANIAPLTNPPEVVDAAGFPDTFFMSFNTAGVTTQLMINFIDPGIYSSAQCGSAPASGQTCTIAGSLFSFVNNVPPSPPGTACGGGCQATATWVFEGITAGNPNPQSKWIGNFSSQFPVGTPYQTVFSNLAANGFVSNTFSGTITLLNTPEPGTLLMIGTGLFGLAAFLRRRAVK